MLSYPRCSANCLFELMVSWFAEIYISTAQPINQAHTRP
jgi:hypothetical protein